MLDLHFVPSYQTSIPGKHKWGTAGQTGQKEQFRALTAEDYESEALNEWTEALQSSGVDATRRKHQEATPVRGLVPLQSGHPLLHQP